MKAHSVTNGGSSQKVCYGGMAFSCAKRQRSGAFMQPGSQDIGHLPNVGKARTIVILMLIEVVVTQVSDGWTCAASFPQASVPELASSASQAL